jgi:FixJ family two-component response regulator
MIFSYDGASAREYLANAPKSAGAACLVLDVQLPEITGIDSQQALNANHSIMSIIFITGHGDIPMSVKAMKAGAVDFLSKPVQEKGLLRAVEQGLTRAIQSSAERQQLEDVQRRLNTLTPREPKMMNLVVTGMLNKQIAFELGTVEKTVKVHRARVMEKMKVDSFADLVRLAERAGIARANRNIKTGEPTPP